MAEANDGLVSALARVAQGDRQAFAGFYQQTHRAVFGMCLHLLRDKDEACDVLQETYIQVWHHAGGCPLAATAVWMHCADAGMRWTSTASAAARSVLLPALWKMRTIRRIGNDSAIASKTWMNVTVPVSKWLIFVALPIRSWRLPWANPWAPPRVGFVAAWMYCAGVLAHEAR